MISALDPLREFTYASVLFRLALATFCGGMLGLERGRKGRPAGFRTYMLVCIGATLTGVISQYEYLAIQGPWKEIAILTNNNVEVTRMGAEVLNGIGFLGAGTIFISAKQEVKGLTTAACLWTGAVLGIAIGAGFYEAVFFTTIVAFITVGLLPAVETKIIERSQNMNIYIEFDSINHLGRIIAKMKTCDLHIFDIDVEYGDGKFRTMPSAVFYTRLNNPKTMHNDVLSNLSGMNEILRIKEI